MTRSFLAVCAALLAFLAGCWFGSRDRECVTAQTSYGLLVVCGHGAPKGEGQ